MKILMVCPDWFPFSAGLAQSCHALCTEFESHGHEVRVLVADDGNIEKKGLDVYPIPYAFRILGRSPVVWNIWKKVKSHVEWCDCVCLFSYMYVMNSQIVKCRTKGRFNKPIIHFYRGSLEDSVLSQVSFLVRMAKKVYDKTVGKRMFTQVDHIISNAKGVLSLINQRYGVSKKKMTYVKNSLHIGDFSVTSKKKKRVIFIGRLIENKGVKLFEQILKVIPTDWEFMIVGDGPMLPYVKDLATRHTQVVVKGKQPYFSAQELLAESSVLVLPSFAEGSPRVVMEASAYGVPSVAFAVGDVPETIPAHCGCVISCFDIEEFTKQLQLLIANDSVREKMGVAARVFAEKELDWKKNYPMIEKELREVVQ